KHPVKAVEMMANIARYTETDPNLLRSMQGLRAQRVAGFTHAIVCSAREAAVDLKAKAILVFTQTGYTAQLASSQRMPCIIYAFPTEERVFQQLALYWGVRAVFFDSPSESAAMIRKAEDMLLEAKAVEQDDVLIIISGTQNVPGATNMMKIERL